MPRNSESAAASPSPRTATLFQLLAIVLLWNCGYKGARVANTLYALELGAGPFDTGLLLATFAVFPLFLAIFTGKIADRYGVRAPFVIGTALSALGILLPFIWPVFPALFASAAVCGAGFILVQVPMQSLLGSLGSGPARSRNLNLYALLVATSDLIGPVVAGFSIDHFGHASAFLHLAVPGVAAVLAVLWIAGRLPHAAGAAGDRGQQGMADLFRIPELRRMMVTSAVIVSAYDLFQLYLPLYGHEIGLSASVIGVIMGAFAAAGFVTRALLMALLRRLGEEATLRYAMFLSAATLFLIPLFENAAVLATVCFVLGLGMGVGQPLTVILTYNYSPAGRHGEALGLRIATNNTMHLGVPALFGAVGSLLGLAPVFWLSSAILALGGYAGPVRGT
jgi:MFS family permease